MLTFQQRGSPKNHGVLHPSEQANRTTDDDRGYAVYARRRGTLDVGLNSPQYHGEQRSRLHSSLYTGDNDYDRRHAAARGRGRPQGRCPKLLVTHRKGPQISICSNEATTHGGGRYKLLSRKAECDPVILHGFGHPTDHTAPASSFNSSISGHTEFNDVLANSSTRSSLWATTENCDAACRPRSSMFALCHTTLTDIIIIALHVVLF